MNRKRTSTIQRGQAITFRLPSDTPDHILNQLQKLRETKKRNFSSTIAEFALEGVKNSLVQERESITIPLPKQLTKEQRNWLRHSHSETLIGTIVYQLLEDPVRATALFATLNSSATDIDEALYLQEKVEQPELKTSPITQEQEMSDDDLEHFDLDKARQQMPPIVEEEEQVEDDATDLLGDFISQMNK